METRPDPLDDLLTRSAPLSARLSDDAVRAMLAEARAEATPPRRRIPRVAIGAGLALLLVGGAGAATASSTWLWGPGTSDPHRSYAFTSPTWGACELRFGDFVAANPLRQAEVDRVIDEWFAETDIAAEAAPLVGSYLRQIESDQASQPEVLSDPRLPDLNFWMASDSAVGELLHDELAEHGFDNELGTGVVSSASQVHCDGEDWG